MGIGSTEGTARGLISGYASVFGVHDLAGDVVLPGAFARSLARRPPDRVRMFWQHDPGQPIGRWLEMREDQRGLFVRGELNLSVQRAAELHALARDGAVDGLSIGFRAVQASRDAKTGLRALRQIDLWEVSLVSFPMQPRARLNEADPRLRDGPAAPAPRAGVAGEARMIGALRRMTRACGAANPVY